MSIINLYNRIQSQIFIFMTFFNNTPSNNRNLVLKAYGCHHQTWVFDMYNELIILADRMIVSPNVLPLSLLTLITGSLIVALRSHQLTYTLLAAAAICTSCDCELEELLKLILSTNVLPPSVDALNITSSFPVLLDHLVTYKLLSPDVADWCLCL